MEPIHRQPLAIQVASRIRDLIATDQFPPGTPLKEVNLCKQLSVSRTPLREALKQLIAEGLVEQIPYRGVVVCNPDQASIEQMLELLGALEGFAGEMACLQTNSEFRKIYCTWFALRDEERFVHSNFSRRKF